MNETISFLLPIVLWILLIALYVSGFRNNAMFREALNTFSLTNKKTSTWLYWLKFIMPIGLLLGISNVLAEFRDVYSYDTNAYTTGIIVIYLIYVCLSVYIYLGLSYLKKEAYLCVKYLFFIQYGIAAIPPLIIYVNTGVTDVLAKLVGALISTLIIGIPHAIYIGKRKALFRN